MKDKANNYYRRFCTMYMPGAFTRPSLPDRHDWVNQPPEAMSLRLSVNPWNANAPSDRLPTMCIVCVLNPYVRLFRGYALIGQSQDKHTISFPMCQLT